MVRRIVIWATTVALAVGATSAAAGCPDETAPADPDAFDAAGDLPDEVAAFDPTAPAPYSCDYTPAGSYTKAAADACDLLAQDCDNTQLACALTDQGTRCLPRGDRQCALSCSLVNDCGPGLVCVGSPQVCRAACRIGDPCPGDTVCRKFSGRDDLGFCPVPCSVLEPDCPGDDACYLVFGNMECAQPATPSKGEGDRCSFGDECEPGLVCQDAGDLRCLTPCLLTPNGAPDEAYPCLDEDQECKPLQGLTPLGVCVATSPGT